MKHLLLENKKSKSLYCPCTGQWPKEVGNAPNAMPIIQTITCLCILSELKTTIIAYIKN